MTKKKKRIKRKPSRQNALRAAPRRRDKKPRTTIEKLAMIAAWVILILTIFVLTVYTILYDRFLDRFD
jgi:ABC-type Fe3+ transport system permease subunit